ncbi:MAG: MBOAT family O-acyltransferase [Eubacterium sp.]
MFYLMSGVKVLLFLLFTTFVVYGGALWMEKVRKNAPSRKAAKATNKKILLAEALINFGILFILKYYNFIAENIDSLFGVFRYHFSMPLVNLVLPLGISFYTFQAVGYSIDVYRGKTKAEKNFFQFALFISFFPQMTQGPISRYHDLAPQLKEGHSFSLKNLKFGMELVLWGYFKKLVIADRAGMVVSQVFGNPHHYDGLQVLTAMGLYAIQIYTDFSGGIDMTRGIAEAMGIHLVDNFRQPYFGNTLSEYWRRWHMSLTNWMRDYVFFPLTFAHFSNKIGKWGRKHLGPIGKQLPAYIPTFVTFMLIGIWHGAGWGFIVFGLYNSCIIILSMAFTPLFKIWKKALHINEKSFLWRVFQIVRTFLILVYGKTITRAGSLSDAFWMMRRTFTINTRQIALLHPQLTALGLSGKEWLALFLAFCVLFTVSVLREKGISIRESVAAKPAAVRWVLILGLLAVVLIFGVYGEGYSSSNFVYRNF